MKRKTVKNKITVMPAPILDQLLGQLRVVIEQSRQQAIHAVDVVQVRTCWEVGQHIVEFEQGGAERARIELDALPSVVAVG